MLHKTDYNLILAAKPRFCSLSSWVTAVTSEQKQFGLWLNTSDGTGGPQPSPLGIAKSTLAHAAEELWARLGLLWGDNALPADGDRKI